MSSLCCGESPRRNGPCVEQSLLPSRRRLNKGQSVEVTDGFHLPIVTYLDFAAVEGSVLEERSEDELEDPVHVGFVCAEIPKMIFSLVRTSLLRLVEIETSKSDTKGVRRFTTQLQK